MYRSELDNLIYKKQESNSFVFFGESSFLIDIYVKKICSIQDSSLLSFYYDEYEFSNAKAHLSQASLFGGRNILLIKSDKKVAKKELDTLIDYCEKNRDNIFVYAYYGSDHKTYNNKKTFLNKSTNAVRFYNPKDYEAQNIVLSIAQNKKININKNAITHLLRICNYDLALSCNELDKLSISNEEINTKDIDLLVYGLSEISIDDLINKIINKKDFTYDVKNMLERGEDEIRIITALSSFFTQLYMFNIYIRVNGTPNAKDILGYLPPKFVVDEKANLSLKFKPNVYYKLHELLLECELIMKSLKIDKESILLSTLIRVQQLI